jgi:hypothetical protein
MQFKGFKAQNRYFIQSHCLQTNDEGNAGTAEMQQK